MLRPQILDGFGAAFFAGHGAHQEGRHDQYGDAREPGEQDVVADLNVESFVAAYARFTQLAAAQLQKRKDALISLRSQGVTPDLYTGSPCLFCLQSFGKIPWR